MGWGIQESHDLAVASICNAASVTIHDAHSWKDSHEVVKSSVCKEMLDIIDHKLVGKENLFLYSLRCCAWGSVSHDKRQRLTREKAKFNHKVLLTCLQKFTEKNVIQRGG